jgi:ferrous iron transport protein A
MRTDTHSRDKRMFFRHAERHLIDPDIPPGCPGPAGELCEHCTLDAIRSGEHIEILGVDDEHARIQALRFGMAEGACVQCVTRIPAGPLVLRSGRQEIAVGRNLAKRIRVRKREA